MPDDNKTDDNKTQLMDEKEIEKANKCLFWSSIMGVVFSLAVLSILIIMFFTYEMFLVKQVNPVRFKDKVKYDEEDGLCEEEYESVFPLMRFNLTRKEDLYGVYKSIGDFENLFTFHTCKCAQDRNLNSSQISFLQHNEDKRLRVCNYLCNFKNEEYENIDGHGYDALTGREIASKMIGLRPDDLLLNTSFEQEFFYEVCMEHFEEWTDYQDRKCDTCAEDYYSFRTLINTTVSSDGKECIRPFRKLEEKKRIQPREYKRCTTCTKNKENKNDPCYSHALCSYMTDGKASVAVFRGSDAYCVKPGCTNTEHFDGSNTPSLIDIGRKYENSRQIYATYFITFCFGIVYSICTIVFFSIRLVNGYELCNRADYEKKNIAKKKLIDQSFNKKELKTKLEEEKNKLNQDAIRVNRENKLQGSGYSTYVSTCLMAFIYAHVLQGLVFLALTTFITFWMIGTHTEIAQEVQDKDLLCNTTMDIGCADSNHLIYFGQLNPLFTSKAGTTYDLYGWTLSLWVFTICLWITDMGVGTYLFTRKENKFNLKDAIIKTFFNKRGNSILKSILKRKIGHNKEQMAIVNKIIGEVNDLEEKRKKESVEEFTYKENEAGGIEMTNISSNSNAEENDLRHRVNIRF